MNGEPTCDKRFGNLNASQCAMQEAREKRYDEKKKEREREKKRYDEEEDYKRKVREKCVRA